MGQALAAGSRVGPYDIVAPLDSGGMATLFLARARQQPSRLIALKIARAHLARDAGHAAMFVEEARLGARLGHPNLVPVEASGEDGGIQYMAMPYVVGVSLAQLLPWLVRTGRTLRPELAVHVAIGVARALHFAHELADERGAPLDVVHRDVSPHNVLIGVGGEVKLIDFGVAKASGRNWATMQGSLKGKLAYMSPEQARAGTIDRRTDVFALGVVLWEMLTHRRLFAAEGEAELVAQVQRAAVQRPRVHAPWVSEAIDGVVMNALAARPEERFASAAELEHALSRACPEALVMDRAQLGSLVACAVSEQRDEASHQVLAATGLQQPSGPQRTVALAAFTQQRTSGPLPLVAAPPTRVLTPMARSGISPLHIAALAVTATLLLASSAGAAFWMLARSRAAPPAAAAPLPVAAPGIEPLVPMIPSVAPVSPPEVVLGTSEPEPETSTSEAPSARRDRHRSRRDRAATLPPPWGGPADDRAASTTMPAGPGAPSRGSALPPPANEARRGPVRLPPGPPPQ